MVPDLGPIQLSNLFQRRAESKELLSDSYVKFEDYDNLSELSFDQHVPEFISVPPYYVKNERRCKSEVWSAFISWCLCVAGSREGCLWIT